MKKITLIAAVIVAASFASCKKDYTCTCSYTGGGSNITKIIGVSKKTAQANCVTTKDSDGDVTTCVLSK